MQQTLQASQHRAATEPELIQAIKANEATTGRLGHAFIARKNGELKTVILTVEGGFLIADGKALLDLSEVEVLAYPVN